ncbi:UDP-N-acetylmuramoyl-tripeptide--D-alanyl-D-alanine ligase [bacterium]|nr:UDP-N-acetylmuramoyl-tripeptide--D-alanyl-D-alanine ligase [bacterium]
MERIALTEIAEVLGLSTDDVTRGEVIGVSTDSRTTRSGDLFFALRGDRFDGHRFVADALISGAVAAVVDSAWVPTGGLPPHAILAVADALEALQSLSAWYRSRFDLPVVAITGSNGKTTTKDMTAAAIGAELVVWKTAGNYNNHIGVPLTLFGIERAHEAAVIEIGMNHPGEIGCLAELVKPRVGVVTNVAAAHIESMRDLDGVARAKAELIEALPSDGTAVLNADDARVRAMGRTGVSSTVLYGFSADAEVAADDVSYSGSGVRFRLRRSEFVEEPVEVEVMTPGRHSVYNALAAIAAAIAVGVPAKAAAEGLRTFRPSAMRMDITEAGGVTIINDAYNANPASVIAALETLVEIAAGRPTIAALGDMLEMGEGSAEAHRSVGTRAAELGVGSLYLYGAEVATLADAAVAAGMRPEQVHVHDDKGTLARDLLMSLERDAVLLVKGSRGMRMEEVVELLESETPVS